MKKAVLNVGHIGCIGSIKIMLNSLGYEVVHLNDEALSRLSSDNDGFYIFERKASILMGYSKINIPYVDEKSLRNADLFVDVKEGNLDIIKKRYPHLKLLHFVINSGKEYETSKHPTVSASKYIKGFSTYIPYWNYLGLKPRKVTEFTEAIDLLHNPYNWGFGEFVDDVRRLGVKFHGDKKAPDNVLGQSDLPRVFSTTKALVHLKGCDCPGYAIYEAMAAGVPVVIPHMFIDRTQFHELFIPDETCLTFGRDVYTNNPENPDSPLNEEWDKYHDQVVDEIKNILDRLEDKEFNQRIGYQGYKKWKELTKWTETKANDLKEYFKQNSIL